MYDNGTFENYPKRVFLWGILRLWILEPFERHQEKVIFSISSDIMEYLKEQIYNMSGDINVSLKLFISTNLNSRYFHIWGYQRRRKLSFLKYFESNTFNLITNFFSGKSTHGHSEVFCDNNYLSDWVTKLTLSLLVMLLLNETQFGKAYKL